MEERLYMQYCSILALVSFITLFPLTNSVVIGMALRSEHVGKIEGVINPSDKKGRSRMILT